MNRQHAKQVDGLETSGENLLALIGTLTERELAAAPDGGWTLHQQLAHLRDSERQVFLHRTERILKEEHPAVANFDQEAYMQEHYSSKEPVKQIAAEFRRARRRVVRLLRGTSDRDWSRTAAHSAYGTISLEWLVHHNYAHTLDHMAQILYFRDKDTLKRLNP